MSEVEISLAVTGLIIYHNGFLLALSRARLDSNRNQIKNKPINSGRYKADFCSFHLEISNCDATRALFELESHRSY